MKAIHKDFKAEIKILLYTHRRLFSHIISKLSQRSLINTHSSVFAEIEKV